MRVCKPFVLCSALLFILSGQTPAPQGSLSLAKPLRHLEYAFQVEYVTNGEGHGSGMSGGGEGGVGSGVNTMLASGGRRGTIDIDVTGIASDGALIIAVNEMLQYAPRPNERFTCTVYGDGHVMCPTADGPLSDAENLVLSFLGRGFIDPGLTAANNHWQRNYEGKEVTVVTDYTVTDVDRGDRVTVVKHSKITSRTRTVGNSVEDGRVVYDRALSIPDTVHDTVYETEGSGSLLSTFDLTLTMDSFAKP